MVHKDNIIFLSYDSKKFRIAQQFTDSNDTLLPGVFSGHGAALGRIFFGFWCPKSYKQWKVLRDCLKNLPTGGTSGNQSDYPWNLPRATFPDNPFVPFPVHTSVSLVLYGNLRGKPSREALDCTVRSWLHKVLMLFRTFSLQLEENDILKCSSDNDHISQN